MSNRPRLHQLNRTNGAFQRAKINWRGRYGNPRTRAELDRQRLEDSKPKFALPPKDDSK